MSESHFIKYRPDIDGLRAVAVVSVVLYHAGLELFSGGFVGVDVFFVISGYLITSIILREIEAGTFSVAGFYERRIRRIFPALFVMLAVSSVMAMFLLLPVGLTGFSESLVATTLFASNFYFWRTASYFDLAADFRPLLHTWSLAVEEQYYIAFPVALMILSRLRLSLGWLFLPAFSASLAISAFGVFNFATSTFYLPVSRAWELLLGSILALHRLPEARSTLARNALGIAGIVAITYAILRFSTRTPFPGLNALFPCVGAALIIHAGTQGGNLASQLLSSRPMVLIGLISYSLYLWHWPILAFGRHIVSRSLTLAESAAAVALSVVVAVLSYRYVESPLRKRGGGPPARVIAYGLSAMVVFISAGAIATLSGGFPDRLSPQAAQFIREAPNYVPFPFACAIKTPEEIDKSQVCTFGTRDEPPSVVLFGDSFAFMLMPQFDELAKESGGAGVFIGTGGCYPLVGIRTSTSPNCRAFVDAAIRYVGRTPSIETVALIGRWPAAVEGSRFGALKAMKLTIDDDLSPDAREPEEFAAVFERGLTNTIRALAGRKIFVVAYVPEQAFVVPNAAVLRQSYGFDPHVALPRALFDGRQATARSIISKLAARHGFDVIDASERLCDAAQCKAVHDGTVLYSDDNHLNYAGGTLVKPLLAPIFESADSPDS